MLTTSQIAQLKFRCDAQVAAKAALELINESIAGDSVMFWQEIRDEALKHAPFTVAEQAKLDAAVDAMTDTEVAAFEVCPMPYGKHQGTEVGSVPWDYLDYLVGLQEGHDRFKDDLRRYMIYRRAAYGDELEDSEHD